MRETIGARFQAVGGRPSGFDYMRLLLAISVLCVHSVGVCYGPGANRAVWTSAAAPLVDAIVPMFFVLSGFLITGSIERTRTVTRFVWLRVLRLIPALSAEILLSALLIGPFVTTLTPAEYFSSNLFWSYFWNAAGFIHYQLPGVFANNPFPDTVNLQLWTVPFEIYAYGVVCLLVAAGITRRKWLAPVSALAVAMLYLVYGYVRNGPALWDIHDVVQGPLLISCFLAGISMYLYRDCLPYRWSWFGAATVVSLLLLSAQAGKYVAPFFIAYATVFLGLRNPARTRTVDGVDYSYGVYLYAFVIQQVVAQCFPWSREWWINIALSLPLVGVTAMCSWRLVERPAMQLRHIQSPFGSQIAYAGLTRAKL